MAKDTKYTSKDIQILNDREHVHKRLSMYAGNTNLRSYDVPVFTDGTFAISTIEFVPAVLKTVGEILDNCQDELTQLTKKNKKITITSSPTTGQYEISDNGRGVPIDKHETGKYTPELVFGSLRAGRNFEETETGVIGMNGMGSSITNYCSSSFEVTINRDGKQYHQLFTNGAETVSKPSITAGPKTKTGTCVKFTLDPTVFSNGVSIPTQLMLNRSIEIAFNHPGVEVVYNGQLFQYKNGLADIVKGISSNYFKFETQDMEFFVIFDLHEGLSEHMFTWVNGSLLYDGGLCNTQFTNAFSDAVVAHLTPQAKKSKCLVNKQDACRNLLILSTIKIQHPEYDAQSKTRLTGPCLRKTIKTILNDQWKTFSRLKKQWLADVLEYAERRHHSSANKKAEHTIANNKKKVPGLMDATGRYRHDCILIVTEGDSAANKISEVRDPETMGSFPLTGKINNVFGETPATLLKMTKVINLIQAIGLVPGRKAVRKDLSFGRVWISTDSDPDGDDICTLLTNLFFQFWPELLSDVDSPFIYRLIAPNVVATKGSKFVHFPNRSEYESRKHKYANWEIEYFKGLGSMSERDWNVILYDAKYQIPIVDTGTMAETLDLLFNHKRSDDRKQWLGDSTTC